MIRVPLWDSLPLSTSGMFRAVSQHVAAEAKQEMRNCGDDNRSVGGVFLDR
jgi:hypothetical protein